MKLPLRGLGRFCGSWIGQAGFVLALVALPPEVVGADRAPAWKAGAGPLMTRWAKDVSPKNALPEYPRPQLTRPDWQSLNGLWDYAIRPRAEAQPTGFDGKILVPFAIESALSGVMKTVGESNRLWYQRTFEIPRSWRGKRVLVHFGAVDWEATVFVNGKEVGAHKGGYDGFSVDVTSALNPTGAQQLSVAVWDPTDAMGGTQPRGKQIRQPRNIWYTSVTGIWQSVWLEPVAETSVVGLKLVPDIDAGVLRVTADLRGNAAGTTLDVVARDGLRVVGKVTAASGQAIELAVPKAKLWSPTSPTLYDLKVTVRQNGKVVDEVSSYFGMRKIALGKDEKGVQRLFLNNAALFQMGPLDQGWWPDGLYTAPTDAALKYDIEVTKQLGFNMARKHVKVEPDRWYYWCDKLGLLVWQDMPSGDRYIGPNAPDIQRTAESTKQFETELKAMIDGRVNHPSIVMWVPFNEGWGQFDTARIAAWVKSYDPSRLVNSVSGWADRNVGDVHDLHTYPDPRGKSTEENRAIVIGEFGGLGLPITNHTWQARANWSYRGFTNSASLTDGYVGLIKRLHQEVGKGVAAAVYTQTTDVEIEINGLLTYDRAIIKGDAAKIRAAHMTLSKPPPPMPVIVPLVPTSKDQAQEWHYTTNEPAATWPEAAFSDAAWAKAPGGFGTRNTPGAVVRTVWNTGDIWMRRSFDLPADFKASDVHLMLHHDEATEVYINGKLVLKVTGFISDYETAALNAEGMSLLKPGANTIAVHCHQTTGGQYIDVGLVRIVPPAATQ